MNYAALSNHNKAIEKENFKNDRKYAKISEFIT